MNISADLAMSVRLFILFLYYRIKIFILYYIYQGNLFNKIYILDQYEHKRRFNVYSPLFLDSI